MPNGKLSITVSSTIQTITVGIGITPIQSHKKELRTIPPIGNFTLPRRIRHKSTKLILIRGLFAPFSFNVC